jgi:hypothetical protein
MFEILNVRIVFDTRSLFTFTIYILIQFHVRSFIDTLLHQLNTGNEDIRSFTFLVL